MWYYGANTGPRKKSLLLSLLSRVTTKPSVKGQREKSIHDWLHLPRNISFVVLFTSEKNILYFHWEWEKKRENIRWNVFFSSLPKETRDEERATTDEWLVGKNETEEEKNTKSNTKNSTRISWKGEKNKSICVSSLILNHRRRKKRRNVCVTWWPRTACEVCVCTLNKKGGERKIKLKVVPYPFGWRFPCRLMKYGRVIGRITRKKYKVAPHTFG